MTVGFGVLLGRIERGCVVLPRLLEKSRDSEDSLVETSGVVLHFYLCVHHLEISAVGADGCFGLRNAST